MNMRIVWLLAAVAIIAACKTDDASGGSDSPQPMMDGGGVPIVDAEVVTPAQPPVLVVSAASAGGLVTEIGGTSTFTVRLRDKPSAEIRVPVVSSNPLEGKASPLELVFAAATYDVPQTVTVTGQDDAVADGDKAFTVTLGPTASAVPAYAGVTASPLSFTNQDDEIAGLFVGVPTPGSHTTEAGGKVSVTVRLRTKPSGDVTIPISTTKPAEASVSVTELVFTTANYATDQTLVVTGVDDAIDDGDEPFSLVLGAASSADARYQGLNAPDVALVNDDDDVAGITVSSPLPNNQTTEAGGQVTFTVVLRTQPRADVTIPVSSSNTDEATVSDSSLVFTAGNWLLPQTITVTGRDDDVLDGPASYKALLGAATSADATYAGMDPADVALVNAVQCSSLAFTGAGALPVSGGAPSEIAGTNAAKHFEAWVRPTSAGPLGILNFARGGTCGTPACGGEHFTMNVISGNLFLDVAQGGGTTALAVPANVWTFVFAGYHPATRYYAGKVAADGTVTRVAVTISNGITGSTLAAGTASVIGSDQNSVGFAGAIDVVRVWSRNPSDAEIAARFKKRLSAAGEVGLVRQWWTQEGAGATADDVTADTSTLVNASWGSLCAP